MMMMKPSVGINFDAWLDSSFVETERTEYTHYISNHNNRRLILLLWEHPVRASYCVVFICNHKHQQRPHLMMWYLTPLSLRTSTRAPFIFRAAAALWRGGGVKQGVKGLQWEGHSSNSKYVSSEHPSSCGWQLTQTQRSATANSGMCLCHCTPEFICRHLLLNIAQQC